MPTESQDALTIDNVTASSGNASWSPTINSRIRNSDDEYTEVDLVTVGSADTSDYLQMEYDTFNNISSTDQIDSLQVSIEGHYESLQHQASQYIYLSDDLGSSFCSGHPITALPVNNDATRTITCSHHSWTYSNIDYIIVRFQVQGADENVTYYVDYSYLTATYSEIAPNVPTNLAADLNVAEDKIDVSWTASTGTTVVNYTVDYNGTTTTVSGTSTTLTNLDPNIQYVIKVRANGTDNSSAYSSTVTTNYTKTASLDDVSFSYAPIREEGFLLKWSNVTSGTVGGWKIGYLRDASNPTEITVSATTFDYAITGLSTTDGQIEFRLTAYNNDVVYDEEGSKVLY